jgi:hypothetical protein
LALAREVERQVPALATSKWWKEERHGVFIDYNQNAKDRTVAGAYSVRPTPDARVSAPLDWDEVDAAEPGDFTIVTMQKRFAQIAKEENVKLECVRMQASEPALTDAAIQNDIRAAAKAASADGPKRVRTSRRAGLQARGVGAKPSSARKARDLGLVGATNRGWLVGPPAQSTPRGENGRPAVVVFDFARSMWLPAVARATTALRARQRASVHFLALPISATGDPSHRVLARHKLLRHLLRAVLVMPR